MWRPRHSSKTSDLPKHKSEYSFSSLGNSFDYLVANERSRIMVAAKACRKNAAWLHSYAFELQVANSRDREVASQIDVSCRLGFWFFLSQVEYRDLVGQRRRRLRRV